MLICNNLARVGGQNLPLQSNSEIVEVWQKLRINWSCEKFFFKLISRTRVTWIANWIAAKVLNLNMSQRDNKRDRCPPRRFRSASPSSPSRSENQGLKSGAGKGGMKTEEFKVCSGTNSDNKVCGKKVDADAPSIKCDICAERYHILCAGYNAKQIKAIKDMSLILMCQGCMKVIPDLRKMMKDGTSAASDEVIGEIGKLGRQIEKLEQKLKDDWETVNKESNRKCDKVEEKVGQALDKIEKSLQKNTEMIVSIKMASVAMADSIVSGEGMHASYADVVKKAVGEKMEQITSKAKPPPALEPGMVQECFDRENRKCNMIISNLPEVSNLPGNRMAAEKQAVYDLFHALHLQVDVGKVVRLGAKPGDGRPRLLLVSTLSEDIKWDVVRAGKDLRELEEYTNVYINPDMTRMERQAQGKLRAEVRERREKGEDVFISKGKIMVRKSQRPSGNKLAVNQPRITGCDVQVQERQAGRIVPQEQSSSAKAQECRNVATGEAQQ